MLYNIPQCYIVGEICYITPEGVLSHDPRFQMPEMSLSVRVSEPEASSSSSSRGTQAGRLGCPAAGAVLAVPASAGHCDCREFLANANTVLTVARK